MKLSKKLKKNMLIAALVCLITFSVLVVSTYAWYIYNTNAHTTDVKMVAGTSTNLAISNEPKSGYGSATVLDSFVGRLTPVSTNKISGGFQRVAGFGATYNSFPKIVAYAFEPSEPTDYYKTSLYLKTNGENMDIYISDIGFEDSSEKNPISSAIRVGILVHKPGYNQPVSEEYIFEITDKKNPKGDYNTAKGKEGDVLDCTKTDGSTITFAPYNSKNYCNYDSKTGEVTLKENSLKICNLKGAANHEYGDPVQVDVYVYLEGCDPDCMDNLTDETIKNLSISFADIEVK